MCFYDSIIRLPFRGATNIFLWLSVLSSFVFSSLHFVNSCMSQVDFSTEDYNHSLLFCYFIADLITGITGLYGIQENKPKALVPFMVYKIFDIIWMVAVFLYDSSHLNLIPVAILRLGFYSTSGTHFLLSNEALVLILFIFIFVLVLKIFFTIMVYEYYFFLTDELTCRGKAYAILKPKAICYITLT